MKKLITFLGISNYYEVNYEGYDKPTKFTQEAIYNKIGEKVKMYIGITEKAEKNWDSGYWDVKNPETKEVEKKYIIGLKEILDDKKIEYETFKLKDGKNDEEIWSFFDAIFDIIQEGDEIYIDITNSLRSIPVIMMSVFNYAKFVKGIKIKGIYYGAFDLKDNNGGIVPIFDLSLFDYLTEWTFGVKTFLESGNSEKLCEIINSTIDPILKISNGGNRTAKVFRGITLNLEKFSSSLYMVRGKCVSKYGLNLKKLLGEVKEISEVKLKPFAEILDIISARVTSYSGEIVSDINETVRLCNRFGMIQQAYTFLRENILTYLCVKGELDYKNSENREKVGVILNNYSREKHENKKDSKDESSICVSLEINEKYKVDDNIKQIIEPYLNDKIKNLFTSIAFYRNNLNHAEYVKNSINNERIKMKLEEFIDTFDEILKNEIKS